MKISRVVGLNRAVRVIDIGTYPRVKEEFGEDVADALLVASLRSAIISRNLTRNPYTETEIEKIMLDLLRRERLLTPE